MTTIEIYFDGLCEPRNPGGTATFGWLVKRKGKILASGSGLTAQGKKATNNIAEYQALIAALKAAVALDLSDPIVIRGDSQLALYQVSGHWQCRAVHLRPLRDQARKLAGKLPGEVRFEWVPRQENKAADQLSREAYKEVVGQYPPERRKRRR